MGIKYVFLADNYFVRCIGMARGSVSRTLEMIYYPMPPQEGIGWRYIGGNAVTVLVDASMSRDGAVQRLKGLYDDIRVNRVRKRQFDRLDRDKPIKSTFKAPVNTYHLVYAQKILAKPVAIITQKYNHDVVVEHQSVYLGKCLPHYIEHIPFVAPYEAAVTINGIWTRPRPRAACAASFVTSSASAWRRATLSRRADVNSGTVMTETTVVSVEPEAQEQFAGANTKIFRAQLIDFFLLVLGRRPVLCLLMVPEEKNLFLTF